MPKREYYRVLRTSEGDNVLYVFPLRDVLLSFEYDEDGDILVMYSNRGCDDSPVRVWMLELSKIWKRKP
jgi:hypothetical protein